MSACARELPARDWWFAKTHTAVMFVPFCKAPLNPRVLAGMWVWPRLAAGGWWQNGSQENELSGGGGWERWARGGGPLEGRFSSRSLWIPESGTLLKTPKGPFQAAPPFSWVEGAHHHLWPPKPAVSRTARDGSDATQRPGSWPHAHG